MKKSPHRGGQSPIPAWDIMVLAGSRGDDSSLVQRGRIRNWIRIVQHALLLRCREQVNSVCLYSLPDVDAAPLTLASGARFGWVGCRTERSVRLVHTGFLSLSIDQSTWENIS